MRMHLMTHAVLLVLSVAGCCCNGTAKASPPLSPTDPSEPTDWIHRIIAYGDTRTGFRILEDQGNKNQQRHRRVVEEIENRLAAKAPSEQDSRVVFTGDAVYAGGASWHWTTYLDVIKKFKSIYQNNPNYFAYFPCIGNHELLPAISGIFAPSVALESPTNGIGSLKLKPRIMDDANRKSYADLVSDREAFIARNKQHAVADSESLKLDERIAAFDVNELPRLEQKMYELDAEIRGEAGAELMRDVYENKAGFSYLHQKLINGCYYSDEFPTANPEVLILMLDTNALDWEPQRQWFENTIANSKHRAIIVFGHHPPGTIKTKGKDAWGEWLLPYLKNDDASIKKPNLWIFGHNHAYEQYLKRQSDGSIERAMFVSGGGGAPLEPSEFASKPQLPGWETSPANSTDGAFYHFLDIRITHESIYVSILGQTDTAKPFLHMGATHKIPLKN